MAGRTSKFGFLVSQDPEAARRQLTLAFYRSGGMAPETAGELGLSLSSYHRLKRVLGLPKVPPLPEGLLVDDRGTKIVKMAEFLIRSTDAEFDAAYEALETAVEG